VGIVDLKQALGGVLDGPVTLQFAGDGDPALHTDAVAREIGDGRMLHDRGRVARSVHDQAYVVARACHALGWQSGAEIAGDARHDHLIPAGRLDRGPYALVVPGVILGAIDRLHIREARSDLR